MLSGAFFFEVDLRGADLCQASLKASTFVDCKLDSALFGADLGASMQRVSADGTDFAGARVGGTVWGNVDLRQAKN
jgi:uncharacterized protein YjbI with pentapeptide repeats